MATIALSHTAQPLRAYRSSAANRLEVTSLLRSAQGSECSVGGVVGCSEIQKRLRGSVDGSDEQVPYAHLRLLGGLVAVGRGCSAAVAVSCTRNSSLFPSVTLLPRHQHTLHAATQVRGQAASSTVE